MPTEMATIMALKRLCLKSTPARMRMPVAATMPNIIRPARPSTTVGSDSTSAAIFGSKPSSSSTTPPATKPLAKRVMSRIDTSTSAAMPTPVRSAYLGLGTLGAIAMPLGTAGMAEPGAPAVLAASSSHLQYSRLTTLGAVGPTGLPKIQLMPTRIRLMPMIRMMVPVTTGGKNRSMRLTMGAMAIDMTPAPMMAPKIAPAPATPGLALAMATMGATAAKVTPIITGSLLPNYCVPPSDWISVTRPQQNRSAEISMATCSGLNLSARPTMSGTAAAPAYITSTC